MNVLPYMEPFTDLPPWQVLLKPLRMALVDSEASFKSRCLAVCGNEDLWKSLIAQNIKTYSDLSFGCGTPQSPPSDDDFRSFAQRICGPSVSIGDTSKLRRLHFESATLIVAHLRQQVSSEASDTVRKLPQAEKTARYADLKARLKGLVIEDELLTC